MLYAFDPTAAQHAPPPGLGEHHYEVPERTIAIDRYLRDLSLLEGTTPVTPVALSLGLLRHVHDDRYAHWLLASDRARDSGDEDTYVVDGSVAVALRAAGLVLSMAAALLDPSAAQSRGFANVRPPGHHATRDRCMGFCLVANVALAAVCAAKRGWRVAVVDWDVHAGNGTEDIVRGVDSIRFTSMHRHERGFYPYREAGGRPGAHSGNVTNVALRGRKGSGEELRALVAAEAAAIRRWRADLVIVSCGFDACEGDPLGGLDVPPDAFGDCTGLLKSSAPRIMLVLEGGYNLTQLPRCAEACVRSLLKA